MNQSFGYILNRRPFRDSSLLLDIFTESHGRICCVARPAKKRGKIIKGNLEPFRYHHLQWIGKGDVQTLTEVDERGRHLIPASELMLGLYLNELLLLLTRQHVAVPELFSAYKYTLHKIGDSLINKQILMRFEMYLLNSLGYPIENRSDKTIDPEMRYCLVQNRGLITSVNMTEEDSLVTNVTLSGEMVLALQDLQSLESSQWSELRQFLDAIFKSISPRVINSRKLINMS